MASPNDLARYQVRLKSATNDFLAIEFRDDEDGGATGFLKALAKHANLMVDIDIRQHTTGGVERVKFTHEGRKFVLRQGDLLMLRNFHDGTPVELDIMPVNLYRRWFEKVADDGTNLNRVLL